MSARIVYAHRSLFGADGYGFVATSEPVSDPMLSRIEALINRLGFDTRALAGAPAWFCLRVESSTRILGEASVREAGGKRTLFYKLVVLPDTADPLAAMPALNQESCWIPGQDGKLPSPPNITTEHTPARPAAGSPDRVRIPFGLVRGIAREALCNWLAGLPPLSRRRATFMVTANSPLGSLNEFLDEVHLTTGKCTGEISQSKPQARSVALPPLPLVAAAALVALAFSFYLGRSSSTPSRAVSGTDQPDAVLTPHVKQPIVPAIAPAEVAGTPNFQSELALLTKETRSFLNEMKKLDALIAGQTLSAGAIEQPYKVEADNVHHYLDQADNRELSPSQQLEFFADAMSAARTLVAIPRNYKGYYSQIDELLEKAQNTSRSIKEKVNAIKSLPSEARNDSISVLENKLTELVTELEQALAALREYPAAKNGGL